MDQGGSRLGQWEPVRSCYVGSENEGQRKIPETQEAEMSGFAD